jgi:hypothetical protein
MTDTWSLSRLLAGLHDDVQTRLDRARQTMGHPVAKGDSSESVWLAMLQTYLPQRYQAAKAFVVDSEGIFSDQIDVVIFDRQYSPFIFMFEGQTIVPAESVYAVFEAKQTVNAALVRYAQGKAASVRALHRTSLPIPHAGGVYPAKPLIPILGGLLTFESDWNPALGKPFEEALTAADAQSHLDLGCVAAYGVFDRDVSSGNYVFTPGNRPATAFLFNLISTLQFSGTVPMIDIKAYSRWLAH